LSRGGVVLLVGAWLVLAPAVAAAGVADRVGATFALMAGDFVKAFQPLEGLVVAVEGGALFIDLGEDAGVQRGQELTVFRRGDTFRHPVNGRPIGRFEEVLGHAQVKRVEARFSEATWVPLPDRPAPQPEDGVRISRARIKVAITPALDLTTQDADVRRVPYLLATVLERSKRFQVVDPLAVGDMFANGAARVEEVLARPERAVRIAKNLEVTAWIVPIVLERRGVLYLDVTWISAVTGAPLLSRRQPLVPASAVEEQRFPWEPRPAD
jgi:Flagellar assembly protein T, C-terminal domain